MGGIRAGVLGLGLGGAERRDSWGLGGGHQRGGFYGERAEGGCVVCGFGIWLVE